MAAVTDRESRAWGDDTVRAAKKRWVATGGTQATWESALASPLRDAHDGIWFDAARGGQRGLALLAAAERTGGSLLHYGCLDDAGAEQGETLVDILRLVDGPAGGIWFHGRHVAASDAYYEHGARESAGPTAASTTYAWRQAGPAR